MQSSLRSHLIKRDFSSLIFLSLSILELPALATLGARVEKAHKICDHPGEALLDTGVQRMKLWYTRLANTGHNHTLFVYFPNERKPCNRDKRNKQKHCWLRRCLHAQMYKKKHSDEGRERICVGLLYCHQLLANAHTLMINTPSG